MSLSRPPPPARDTRHPHGKQELGLASDQRGPNRNIAMLLLNGHTPVISISAATDPALFYYATGF